MKAMFSERPTAVIHDLFLLSSVLFRLENSRERFDADQYRALVAQIVTVLKAIPPGPEIDTVLGTFPATADIYENLRYEHAGLCLMSLEDSMDTEGQAFDAIARAKRRTVA